MSGVRRPDRIATRHAPKARSAGHQAGVFPASHQHAADGARRREPDDHGRRIRLDRGAVRLRQDHVPLGGGRADRRDFGPHPGRRQRGDEAGAGPRGGVSGRLAAAVADRGSQRPLWPGMPRRQNARGQGTGGAFYRDGRAVRLRASLSLRALRRHAAAREPCARAGHGPEDPADGRAVRLARRADPRGDAGGTAAHLDASRARPCCS